MSALPVLAALLVAAASPRAPVLRVLVENDEAARCRANAALVKAVRARLPAVRVATSGAPGPEDLSASMTPDGEAWRFEVRRAGGGLAMTRTLRRLQCAQLGDTGALILERYLEEISWRGRAVGIEPLPRAGAKAGGARGGSAAGSRAPAPDGGSSLSLLPDGGGSASAASPDGGSPLLVVPAASTDGGAPVPPSGASGSAAARGGGSLLTPGGATNGGSSPPGEGSPVASPASDGGPAADRPAPDGGASVPVRVPAAASSAPDGGFPADPLAPPPEPLFTGLTLSAGGAAWLQLPLETGPVLSLELGADLGRYRVGLLLIAGWPTEHPIVIDARLRGATRVQAFLAGATATRCFGEGLSLCGGLLGAARLTAGSATGTGLYRQRTALVPLGELGLYGRLSYPLTRRLEASLDLAAAAPLGSASFGIEGADSAPAGTPALDLISNLRVGWRFF